METLVILLFLGASTLAFDDHLDNKKGVVRHGKVFCVSETQAQEEKIKYTVVECE